MNSDQQIILGLASALGTAFMESLKQDEANRAKTRQQEMERATVEMARFQAEERKRMEELEQRHQKLLGDLKGGLGHTELGLKPIESGTLELKTGTNYFGIPSNPTGTMKLGEETADITMKTPDVPPEPTAKFVAPSQLDTVMRAYYEAGDKYAKSELHRQQLENDKKIAKRIRREAEKKYREQQERVALIADDQPAKQEEDDKLAKAQKLLDEATSLDNSAEKNLEQAKRDVDETKRELDKREKARNQAEKNLPQATMGQPR